MLFPSYNKTFKNIISFPILQCNLAFLYSETQLSVYVKTKDIKPISQDICLSFAKILLKTKGLMLNQQENLIFLMFHSFRRISHD